MDSRYIYHKPGSRIFIQKMFPPDIFRLMIMFILQLDFLDLTIIF